MSAAERLGLSPEKVVINIEKYGNTTAGTIPLALADAVADGRLKKGNLVLLASVGAGFTVGSVLLALVNLDQTSVKCGTSCSIKTHSHQHNKINT